MFLKILAALAGLGGGWAGLRAAFTSKGSIDEWTSLGPLDAAPVDTPEQRSVTVTERLGWLERSVEKEIWMRRDGDGAVMVFSAACPHEACAVQKDANAPGFVCLCHHSHFGPDGALLDGPALRGLDTLEHRLENGVLWARYQKFKKQLRAKEVVS
ncbi:MAG TPA: Rieske (2Fe-2S) protein [Terriglobia bacterium]|nr:Rieske (2Fe-2S) protein [Terriglobia bacterium]